MITNGNSSGIRAALKNSYQQNESDFFELVQLMTPHQIEEFYSNIMESINLDKTPPRQLVLLLDRLLVVFDTLLLVPV